MNKVKCPKCGFNNPENIEKCLNCEASIKLSKSQKFFAKFSPVLGKKKELEPSEKIVKKVIDTELFQFTTSTEQVYIVLQAIGSGGYCNVYLVENEKTKELFAIKLLRLWEINQKREDVQTRFWFEYRMSQTQSDYLVKTFGKGELHGNPFYVMEYCNEGTLAQKIKDKWSNTKLKTLATSILKGLQALHIQNVVHRDLKPNNVVFHNGKVKLIDFGISGKNNIRMTAHSEVLGTDVYMAPEWINSTQKELYTRIPTVDIFSFGVLMFELISGGYFPYGSPPDSSSKEKYSTHLIEYFNKVFNNLWENLTYFKEEKTISLFWCEVIEKCIDADPKKRFQNVSEILELLNTTDFNKYCPNCDIEISNTRTLFCKSCGYYLLHGELGLRILVGKNVNMYYNLSEIIIKKGLITLGRLMLEEEQKNDISFDDFETIITISRHHATIEKSNKTGAWFIRDGQWRINHVGKYEWQLSKNGIYVNSIKIDSSGATIFPDDIITIGNTIMQVTFSRDIF